jgi:hypothetical protein
MLMLDVFRRGPSPYAPPGRFVFYWRNRHATLNPDSRNPTTNPGVPQIETMATMKAMEFTDELKLQPVTRQVPEPQPGEMLIQISAVGLTCSLSLFQSPRCSGRSRNMDTKKCLRRAQAIPQRHHFIPIAVVPLLFAFRRS